MELVVRGALVAILALAIPSAAAAAPGYGGGSLSQAALTSGHYSPTVGITLKPRADGRIAFAFDSTLRCGRGTVPVRARGATAWDGVTMRAAGRSRVFFRDSRLRWSWTVEARVEGDVARGTVQIAAQRHGRACRGRAPRAFESRRGPPPAGAPAQPPAGAAFYGRSRNRVSGRLRGPVVLRVNPDARRVAARWAVAARCGSGPRHRFTNLTPPTRIGAGAEFARRERFSVRYGDAFVRYRTSFRGRFVGAAARGTLRLRATLLDRRGGRVRTRCDTGRRGWTVWSGGEPAPPAPASTPPAPGTPPPQDSPDPQFRPAPLAGSWSLDMTSDPGEYIGQGETWHHGSAYGEQIRVEVFATGDLIQYSFFARDGQDWSATFSSGTGAPLQPGTYEANSQPGPWFGFGGHGRGCGRFTGRFTIAALAYDPNGALRRLRLSFEAHCEALPEALRGDFAFDAA